MEYPTLTIERIYKNLISTPIRMIELHNQDLYDESGTIDYDKVVEQIHNYLTQFLRTCLTECFSLAKDTGFRVQITDINGKARDEALDLFLTRQHVVSSELYVEIESKFYTSASLIIQAKTHDKSQIRAIDTGLIELTLAVDNLIYRTVERHKKSLEVLELRLQELSLFTHQKFNIYSLHPQEFYSSFQNAIAPLKLSADGKILLCKLLYQQISPKLSEFYTSVNNFLIDVDILSTPTSIQSVKKVNASAELDKDNSDIPIDVNKMHLSTGQFFAPVEQEFDNAESTDSHSHAQSDLAEHFEEELNHERSAEISREFESIAMDIYGPGHSGLDPNIIGLILQPYDPGSNSDSSPAQRRQFIRALSTVQRIEAASDAVFKASQIKTAVQRTLHERGALDATEIVANEEKVIDFVSKIFQVILDDEELPDQIKALLAKLQISVIKLALVDFTFFQNSNHPARHLLNKLTSIGVSVDSKNELIFNKLKSVVDLIINNFETDINVFGHALVELKKLDPDNLQKLQQKEERKKQQEKLKAKRSAAKRVVISTIKTYINNRELPNEILEFLVKCWAPHMGIVFTKHGKKSKIWRKSVRTLRRIIEISQGIHSLYDVQQYIKNPDEFFTCVREELKYLSAKKQEFEEITEAAEVWYLTYLHKIQQEANELEKLNEQTSTEPEDTSNVIQLFKNIAPPEETAEVPETLIQQKPDFDFEAEPVIEDESCETINENDDLDEIEIVEVFQDIQSDEKDVKIEVETGADTNTEKELDITSDEDSITDYAETDKVISESMNTSSHVEVVSSENPHLSAIKPDTTDNNEISDFDSDNEKQQVTFAEEETNEVENPVTLADLPDDIIPGVWLEIYQGIDKAKRRLKFSNTLDDSECLVFTDRSGDYTFEIDIKTFMDDLNSGRTRLINEGNRFDLALSSVISNIRDGQSKASGSTH